MSEVRRCARGCKRWGKHSPECVDRPNEGGSCRGCLPRDAEHGHLCYGCHVRFDEHLSHVAGQLHFLEVMSGMRGEIELTSPSIAKIVSRWRHDSNETLSYLYANASRDGGAPFIPARLQCIDAAREVEDRLHLWAVNIESDYQISGPSDQHIGTYAAWLRRHLERIEWREQIGDELGEFVDAMSRAHSLAPWREQAVRLPGIPCPECHATTLARFGGDEFVTCVRCRATMGPGRYGVWTRQLAERHKEATA